MRALPPGTRESKWGGRGVRMSPFKLGSWRNLRSATVHRLSGKQRRRVGAGGKGVSSCSCGSSQKSSGGWCCVRFSHCSPQCLGRPSFSGNRTCCFYLAVSCFKTVWKVTFFYFIHCELVGCCPRLQILQDCFLSAFFASYFVISAGEKNTWLWSILNHSNPKPCH